MTRVHVRIPSGMRRWEPWVLSVGGLMLGLLIVWLYLAHPDLFPADGNPPIAP